MLERYIIYTERLFWRWRENRVRYILYTEHAQNERKWIPFLTHLSFVWSLEIFSNGWDYHDGAALSSVFCLKFTCGCHNSTNFVPFYKDFYVEPGTDSTWFFRRAHSCRKVISQAIEGRPPVGDRTRRQSLSPWTACGVRNVRGATWETVRYIIYRTLVV